MFRKILVPLDGSRLSEQVLPHAAALAQAFGSDVIVVGVCEPEESEQRHACEANIYSLSDRFKRYLGTDASVAVEEVVLLGKPAQEIIRYAESNDVTLIVMASHGRSGLAPWSLGSTVDHVIRRLRYPMLVVRAKEIPEDAGGVGLFRRILTPLDGSERGEAVLPYVQVLTNKLGAEVVLFQAVAHGKHVHSVGGLDYVRFEDHEVGAMRERAREYLAGIRDRISETGDRIRVEVRDGSPATEIVNYADEADCPLVAMSTHGHSFLERWVYGSNTYKVLQASSKSVLLVPSSHGDDD
jgi:nucleotide-binding universal stress UspA family protein